MDLVDRYRLKQYRRTCSSQGWFAMLYLGIMQLSVEVLVLVEAIIFYVKDPSLGITAYEKAAGSIGQTGWPYMVMMAGVLLMLLLVKKPRFMLKTVWEEGRPLPAKDFLVLLILFMGVQGVSQVWLIGMEAVLNSFGYTILERLSMVSGSSDELTMFIYASVGAPIVEELMFRGLVMRSLRPMGKRFSIVVSALMFGLFHGNIVQAPFATLVGLVLGYVATEYNIGWAMLLHMFNNMIFADTLSRVIPGLAGNMVVAAIVYGCLIAGIVILICRRKEIKFYRYSNPKDPLAMKALLTSPGFWVFMAYIVFAIVRTTFILITPLTTG